MKIRAQTHVESRQQIHKFAVGGYGRLISSTDIIRHPGAVLLDGYRDELLKNRRILLKQLEATSRPLAQVVVNLLGTRDKLSPPAIGEAWPWLIGQIAGVPKKAIRIIAKPWLAIYLYTLLLDKVCDESTSVPNPTESLAGALLFEIGSGDFYSITSGTEWGAVARDAIRESIRDQEIDVRLSGRLDNLRMKQRAAVGKNGGFVLCTAALAAMKKIEGASLERFTRSILVAFQHLDDIADFDSDWNSANYTPLLLGARKDLAGIKGPTARRSHILEKLVRSGALRTVLLEAKSSIKRGLRHVANNEAHSRSSLAWDFFEHLDQALTHTLEVADDVALCLKNSESLRRKALELKQLEHQLSVVAQQS